VDTASSYAVRSQAQRTRQRLREQRQPEAGDADREQ
jgi:hypothetical protein